MNLPSMHRSFGVRVVPLVLLVWVGTTGRARAQVEAWRVYGQSSQPMIGKSVAYVGDVNGDGIPDYVAGGPSDNELNAIGIGHALLCSGADGSILIDFAGRAGTQFGAAVASAGDLDADGFDDVAVGAPMDGKGALYIYSGSTGVLLRTLRGATAKSRFGTSLAKLGDVDGDGVPDLAVGASADGSSGARRGLVAIYSGASGAALASWTGSSIDGFFGSVVDDAGDLDGDGLHDVLVVEQADKTSGSPAGTARVYSSASHALLQKWALGAFAIEWRAAGAGDVNADGVGDVIVGNPNWPVTQVGPTTWDTGGVWVYDGSTGAVLYQFTTNYLYTGHAVGAAADVDGDGYADFAFDGQNAISEFFVISGKTGAVLSTGSGTPSALRSGADVDGDGFPDLLAGFASDNSNGWLAGEVDVFNPGLQSFIRTTYGTDRIDALGHTCTLLDDVNGDGARDVLVGTGGEVSLGCARVLSGVDGSELRVHAGNAFTDYYALVVLSLPDLDGDAVGEYAITVPDFSGKDQGYVEVRSGATGNLFANYAPASGAIGHFGFSLAVTIQSSGAVQLAVGSPDYNNYAGAFHVFDLATGATLISAAGTGTDQLGMTVANLGDLDVDGVGDWAVSAPGAAGDPGEVVVYSGATANVITTVTGTPSASLGPSCAAGDVNGDGYADLYVGAATHVTGAGAVFLYSGASGSLLRTVADVDSTFGQMLTSVGDVNSDGLPELLVGQTGGAQLLSGATGGLLYRFDSDSRFDYFGASNAGVAAPGSSGSMNGDSIPDFAIGAMGEDKFGYECGRLQLVDLDDLFLQIDPPTATTGATVNLATSGGPVSTLAALFVVGFDATPLFTLAATGTFDSAGRWAVAGAVPPGLTGHSIDFQSMTIGFTGKLAVTQRMTLTLQ